MNIIINGTGGDSSCGEEHSKSLQQQQQQYSNPEIFPAELQGAFDCSCSSSSGFSSSSLLLMKTPHQIPVVTTSPQRMGLQSCMSLPPTPTTEPGGTSPIYRHPHHANHTPVMTTTGSTTSPTPTPPFQQQHQQQLQQQQQYIGMPLSVQKSPRANVHSHAAVSRQRTMPEGSSLHSLQQKVSPGCVFVMEGSGMRDVPIWLKNLRLHKYTGLFEKMSYEEMMSLTDEWLEGHGVTKGATNKILQNLQKLRDRQNLLKHYERELMQNGQVDIRAMVDALHQMMNTPIKRFQSTTTTNPNVEQSSDQSNDPQQQQQQNLTGEPGESSMQWILGDDSIVPEGDLAGQMTRLIGRLMFFFLIKAAGNTESSLIIHFVKLVDKCMQHEAFSDKHRQLLAAARQRCSQLAHSHSPRNNNNSWNSGSPGQQSISPGASLPVSNYRKQ